MSFKIRKYAFSKAGVAALGEEEKENNWPVIYQIYNNQSLYVGETTNLKNRMFQHLDNEQKSKLDAFSVIFDDTFNKSVALDLEAQLIQWFSGEGKYDMLNRNDGMSDRDYFDRKKYRDQFIHIWEALREKRVASKSVIDIENSGLFKFSPYKVLNEDQLRVVNEILIDLDSAFTHDERTLSVVGGHEGTGKTIVLIYLIKLIRDIQDFSDETRDEQESEQAYDVFFKSPFKDRFEGKTIAVVIPNPSLKGSISKIFSNIFVTRGRSSTA
jgi:predicted GIY-YIG superfamily endonuclease